MLFHPMIRVPGIRRKAFVCKACRARLAGEDDLVSVLERPVRATYQNPQGVACTILTFGRAVGLAGPGESTEEHTWFEGWAWSPVACSRCRLFVGWKYESSEPHADPPAFFGLLEEQMEEVDE